MEPVGLAVGLVGLFSTCMDVMQRVDSYRTAGRDSRQLDAQLKATMHLFEKWGDTVGISKGKLSDGHHPALDDQRTYEVVQGLLNSIKDFPAASDDPSSLTGLQKAPSFPPSGDLPSHGPKITKWQKTTWALRRKLKQTSHVQALAGLVSDLYSVVTPDTAGSKALTRTPSFKDLSISAGEQPYAVEIRELLQKIEEEMEADKIRDLHSWLGAPPPNDMFSDSNDKRVKETCEWILHRDEFLEWQKPSSCSKLLWTKGPAGFGKTVLCARIVQELERTAHNPVALAALDIVTKARLSQHEPLASQAAILQAFHEVIVGVPGCTLVLDGLDECTGMNNADTKSVPHLLQELRIAITDTTTKILISSRGDPLIQQGLSDFAGCSEYTIVPDDVGPDLMAYSSEIEITEAVLVTDDMDELPLEEMPDCVDQDYVDSMILELCGSLIEVRRVSSPESTESSQRIHESEEDSIGLQEVHLSHFSVKEYLLLKTFPGTDALLSNEKLRVTNEEFHNTTLAKHCLRFINLRGAFKSLKMNNYERSGKYDFAFYAVGYGFEHCRLVKTIDPELQQSINAFLDSRNENWPLVKHHLEANMRDDPNFQGSSVSPFVFAIYSGLTDAVAHLIREGSLDMDDRSFGNSTPLFWACASNWNSSCQDVVELLVENGTDINARCYRGQTALHVSAYDEDNGAIGLLLAKGAHVSVVDDNGKTALDVALVAGNTKAARLLLDGGADVSNETADGFTPLSMASSRGYVDLVKILIERGADVNQVVLNGHSSLLNAVQNDHSEIVELLIDKGAKLTSVKLIGRIFSLLDVAAAHGHVNTFKALVGKGAAPTNPQTLFLASSYGY
ncbi:Ankyrin repeat domain-containing 50 [Fusarium acutatum]|uniref:Ankyrin repeat domain-containing 50 n=1 Tax=Fusarium acutatum TaxID=78861 RepID=A0A8H4JF36_9HYPO|nr:Ankyrin repeat domain-containing 50 [Fusarium acutatum]